MGLHPGVGILREGRDEGRMPFLGFLISLMLVFIIKLQSARVRGWRASNHLFLESVSHIVFPAFCLWRSLSPHKSVSCLSVSNRVIIL